MTAPSAEWRRQASVEYGAASGLVALAAGILAWILVTLLANVEARDPPLALTWALVLIVAAFFGGVAILKKPTDGFPPSLQTGMPPALTVAPPSGRGGNALWAIGEEGSVQPAYRVHVTVEIHPPARG